MDWIGHHNDIAHWALGLDKSGPTKVEAVNWKFPATNVYDTPHQYEIVCQYGDGHVSSIASRHRVGTRFIGEDGWLFVTRGKMQASDRRWLKPSFKPGKFKVDQTAVERPVAKGRPLAQSDDHIDNFLSCIEKRQECIAPAETAHRSITPGHLGYLSQAVGRPIRWDPVKETVVGDRQAQQLLKLNNYRSPWEL